MVIKVWHIRTEARFHRALKKLNIPDQRTIIEFLEPAIEGALIGYD